MTDYNLIFASNGAIFDPNNVETDFLTVQGWPDDNSPDLQTQNWVYNDISLKIQDLKDNAIPKHDNKVRYNEGVVSIINNKPMIATGQNINNSGPDRWIHLDGQSPTGTLKYFIVGQGNLQNYLRNGWYVCDGSRAGVPDMRGQFLKGTTNISIVGARVSSGTPDGSFDPNSYSITGVVSFAKAGAHSHKAFDSGCALTPSQIFQHSHARYISRYDQGRVNTDRTGWNKNASGAEYPYYNASKKDFTTLATTDTKSPSSNSSNAKGAKHYHSISTNGAPSHNHNTVTNFVPNWENTNLVFASYKMVILIYMPHL